MTDMERKSIRIELKADSEGSFTARIATLNVVDSDGDLTVPGAFKANTPVLVSAYQHGSWSGALPVGRAVINEKGDEVIAEGQFNLNMTLGREHYEAVKFTDELQEWSYGFDVVESGFGEFEGQEVRFLKKMDVIEVSPVMLGEGLGTHTTAIKGKADDEIAELTAAIKELTSRLAAQPDDAGESEGDGQDEGGVNSDAPKSRARTPSTLAERVAIELLELEEA